jgi:hypothetical protein
MLLSLSPVLLTKLNGQKLNAEKDSLFNEVYKSKSDTVRFTILEHGRVCLFKLEGNNLFMISSFKISAGTGPRVAHMAMANGILFIRHGKVLMAYDLKHQSYNNQNKPKTQ